MLRCFRRVLALKSWWELSSKQPGADVSLKGLDKYPGAAEQGKGEVFFFSVSLPPSLSLSLSLSFSPPSLSLSVSFSVIFWFLLGWKSPRLNGNMWDISCWLDLWGISVCKYIVHTYHIYIYTYTRIHFVIIVQVAKSSRACRCKTGQDATSCRSILQGVPIGKVPSADMF